MIAVVRDTVVVVVEPIVEADTLIAAVRDIVVVGIEAVVGAGAEIAHVADAVTIAVRVGGIRVIRATRIPPIVSFQAGNFDFLGANFSQVVPWLVMFIVLLVRPYGLFGTREVERV